jgi:inosine-uridine nucleoside N-ribohydrolase
MESHFGLLRQHRTAATAFLDAPLHYYRRAGSQLIPDSNCPCHDLVAAIAVVDLALVTGPILDVSVDTGGNAAWGSSVADLRPLAAGSAREAIPFRTAARTAPVEAGLEVDVSRFRDQVMELFGASSSGRAGAR